MEKKKSIYRITLINILSTFIIKGISFFTAPIFSSLMGTENYGVVAAYEIWVNVIVIVFGLQSVSTIILAKGRLSENEQKQYQSSILFLSAMCYIVCSIILLMLISSVSTLFKMSKGLYILMLLQGFGQMCVGFMNAKFIAEFEANKNFVLSLFSSIGAIAIALVLFNIVPKEINYYAKIMGTTIIYSIVAIYTCIYIFRSGKTFFNKKFWKFCVGLSIPYIFSGLSSILLNQSDIVMLQWMTSNSNVGIYSLAYIFSSIMSIIWMTLNNSWMPFYYDYLKQHDITAINKHVSNYAELFTILSIGFVFLSPEVFHIFASKAYWEGTSYIPLFVLNFYFVFQYGLVADFELYNLKSKFVAIAIICTGVLNIAMNGIFIMNIGAIGAVFATVIAHGIQFLVHYFYAIHFIKEYTFPIKKRIFLQYSIPFYIIVVCAFFVGNKFVLIRWCGGIALGVYEIVRIYKRKSIF